MTNNLTWLEMVKELEQGKDFFDLLTFEQTDILNQLGLERIIYMITDNDQISDYGIHENQDIPHFLSGNGKNEELKELAYNNSLSHLYIIGSYYNLKKDNAFVLDEYLFNGEIELDGAECLYSLYHDELKDYSSCEELAEKYNIGYFYYSDLIQFKYYVNFDELEDLISNVEDLYNQREHIIKLIENTEKDDIAFEEFKEKTLIADIEF